MKICSSSFDPKLILQSFGTLATEQKYQILEKFLAILEKNEQVFTFDLSLTLQKKLLNYITPDVSTINHPLSKAVFLLLVSAKTKGVDLREQLLFSGCSHRLRILR